MITTLIITDISIAVTFPDQPFRRVYLLVWVRIDESVGSARTQSFRIERLCQTCAQLVGAVHVQCRHSKVAERLVVHNEHRMRTLIRRDGDPTFSAVKAGVEAHQISVGVVLRLDEVRKNVAPRPTLRSIKHVNIFLRLNN